MRSSVLVEDRTEEGNSVDGGAAAPVNKVDRLDVPMRMAKARVGDAVRCAIGDEPLKAYGDKGLLSGVVSGERVPEYLARIYQDPAARRRLAFALLRDDETVTVRTVIEFNQKVG